jgi:hypothetical protein
MPYGNKLLRVIVDRNPAPPDAVWAGCRERRDAGLSHDA